MNTEQAQSAVSLSAFVVAAIFGYRKLIEAGGTTQGVPSTGHFVIGFGFTYTLLALLAQGAPALGGMMAILVAAGDLLANGKPLINDVTTALKATHAATSNPPATSFAAAPAGSFNAPLPNSSGTADNAFNVQIPSSGTADNAFNVQIPSSGTDSSFSVRIPARGGRPV